MTNNDYTLKPGRIGGGTKIHLIRVWRDGRIGGAACGLDHNSKMTGRRMRAATHLVDGAVVTCKHCLEYAARKGV